MKLLSLILFIVLFVNLKIVLIAESNESWNSYKIQFNKQYETTEIEQQKMKTFLENEKIVAQHNEKYKNGQVKFKMALNHFSDRTPEELKATLTSTDSTGCAHSFPNYDAHVIKEVPPNLGKVPESKDWHKEGAVTSVKNQKAGQNDCGCCWAFSAIGALESHYYIHGPEKKLISLSVQQLLDCMNQQKYGINSCKSGCEAMAFQYVIDNRGIEADQSYPYKATEDKCQYKADNKVVIKNFKTIVQKNEKLLRDIVGLIGPCTCEFDAEDDFYFYSSGIYSGATCQNTPGYINHALLIVGYGTEDGFDYWLCKNQWGTEWGMDGYVKIQRNTNECGIALENHYPIF